MAILNPTQPCHEEQDVKGQRKKHGRAMNLAWPCYKKTKGKKSTSVLKECMAVLNPTHSCHKFSMAISQEDKGKAEHG